MAKALWIFLSVATGWSGLRARRPSLKERLRLIGIRRQPSIVIRRLPNHDHSLFVPWCVHAIVDRVTVGIYRQHCEGPAEHCIWIAPLATDSSDTHGCGVWQLDSPPHGPAAVVTRLVHPLGRHYALVTVSDRALYVFRPYASSALKCGIKPKWPSSMTCFLIRLDVAEWTAPDRVAMRQPLVMIAHSRERRRARLSCRVTGR